MGSSSTASRGSRRARARAPRRDRRRDLAQPVEEGARLLGEVEGGLGVAHALEQRRQLQQRVVAHLRHRRVAGDALACVTVKRKTPFSAQRPSRAAGRRTGMTSPPPSLSRSRSARRRGAARSEPAARRGGRRPPRRRPRSRAGRRAPGASRRGRAQRGDHLGRDLATSCRARRAPRRGRRRVARPRVVGPLVGRRRGRCRRGRGSRASARRGRRAGARRGSGARRRARAACTRSPRLRGSPARYSSPARSLPGGLTVSKRRRRCSTSVVSCWRSGSSFARDRAATLRGKDGASVRDRRRSGRPHPGARGGAAAGRAHAPARRSASSSARRICSARARRCGRRSRRAARTRWSSTGRRARARRPSRACSRPARTRPSRSSRAVEAGRAEVRAVIERAEHRRATTNEPTVLFLDEIHRFNKAQQDTLLPAVEEGLVVLVGRHDREPLLRGDLRPALAGARLRAAPLDPPPTCW